MHDSWRFSRYYTNTIYVRFWKKKGIWKYFVKRANLTKLKCRWEACCVYDWKFNWNMELCIIVKVYTNSTALLAIIAKLRSHLYFKSDFQYFSIDGFLHMSHTGKVGHVSGKVDIHLSLTNTCINSINQKSHKYVHVRCLLITIDGWSLSTAMTMY